MANDRNEVPKKRTLRPPPAEMGIVTPERIRHAIAHTARIQRVLTDKPDHPGREAFEQLIADYKTFLGGVDEETLRTHANDLVHLHDMNKDILVSSLVILTEA